MSQLNYFDENYSIVSCYLNLTKGNKEYIGEKQNRKCRFCGKLSPEVKFKLEAHAIPELTGNKSLIAYNECDTCNEKFSRTVEDHLGKYLGAQRTLVQIHGAQPRSLRSLDGCAFAKAQPPVSKALYFFKR